MMLISWSKQVEGLVAYKTDTGDWIGVIELSPDGLFHLRLNAAFPPEDSAPAFRSEAAAQAYLGAIAETIPGPFKSAPPPWGVEAPELVDVGPPPAKLPAHLISAG